MSRPRMAPTAAALLAALGLAGPVARSQPPAVQAPAPAPVASDTGLPDAMASARTARHLMRNGKDYLSYKQYELALSYLRRAEARQQELSEPERGVLRKAIEQARQGMREPDPTTVATRARDSRGRDSRTPGTFALARPIREIEPIQLASAVVESPKGSGSATPAVAADLPALVSPVPAPLPELPELPGTAEPVAPPPPLSTTPSTTPGPSTAPDPSTAPALPALPTVAAPVVVEPAAVAAPVVEEPVPVAAPVAAEPAAQPEEALPVLAAQPEETLPILAAQPEDALPDLPASPSPAPVAAESPAMVDSTPAPAELAPAPVEVAAPPLEAVASPLEIPSPNAGPEAAPVPSPEVVPTAAAPESSDPAMPPPPEEAPPVATDPAPTAGDPTPSPAPMPELPPVVPPAADVPMPNGEDLQTSRAGGPVSTLTPETRREVEEVARRQEAASRRATDAAPTNRGEQPIGVGAESQANRLELPRAPSPTEARPIRPIPIPEEPAPMTPRRWEPTSKYWASVGSCHTPLYFQDAVLERYGQSVEQGMGPFGRFVTYRLDDPTQSNQRMQIAQPFVSLALFYGQVVALPYNLIVDPPWETEYDLGYYRPGDRIPPDTYYLPWLGVGPPLKGRNYGGFHGHR